MKKGEWYHSPFFVFCLNLPVDYEPSFIARPMLSEN